MRTLAATALLVLAAACATGKPGEPPSIVGNYLLTRIDNRALPTYSPTEPNVTVERGTLILGRGGAFSLTLVARSSPQFPPAERSIRGSYTMSGDSLTSPRATRRTRRSSTAPCEPASSSPSATRRATATSSRSGETCRARGRSRAPHSP